MPAVATGLIALMLDCDLGKVHEDVLHLGVGAAALGAAEVVEPRPLVEQVVHDGDDDDDSDGVGPDDDDSDDAGVAAGEELVLGDGVGRLANAASEPAEDAEEGSNDIDTEDGADELPRGPGLASTGYEDEPVLSEGDLEEEYTLDGAEVLNETTVGEEQGATNDPGTESKEDTEDDRDDPDLG